MVKILMSYSCSLSRSSAGYDSKHEGSLVAAAESCAWFFPPLLPAEGQKGPGEKIALSRGLAMGVSKAEKGQ